MKSTNWECKVLVALLVSILIIPLGISIHTVKADSNNPIVMDGGVTLYSPINTTYYSNFLTLNLTFGCGSGLQCSLNYSVDNEYTGSIPLTINESGSQGFQMIIPETGLVQLPELSGGSHSLTIYVEADLNDYNGANPPGAPFKESAPCSTNYIASWIDKVDFAITSGENTTDLSPPKVTNLSIENQTYNSTNIPIDFTVNENIMQVAYSLDGQANVTIVGNSTLTGLSNGEHNVTVYAWNDAGNVGASQIINFDVVNNSSATILRSDPFPTSTIIAVFISLMIGVTLTFLFFFRKDKR